METDPAKKANKAKIPLEAIYPLEWEEAAFHEVLQGFKEMWKLKRTRFLQLSRKNESIALEERNLPNLLSVSKGLVNLYERIFHELIFREPYLYRMLVYIAMNPEDRQSRQACYTKYLQTINFEAYHDILDIDILHGSDLAKSRKLSGIPVHSCFVGKVLQWMLNRFESQRLTDEGNPELMRFEKIPGGLLIEYMNKADFDDPLADSIADDVLYNAINAKRDRRQHLFFGKGLDHREYRIVKRFGKKEKEIPFQLLPKYAGLIRKRANIDRKYKGTKVISGNENPSEQWDDFEQKAVMLFLEAVLDQTLGKAKSAELPFAAFIENQLLWRQEKEREDDTYQENGKRIRKEPLDQPGKRLVDDIEVDDIEDEKCPNQEAALLDRERDERLPELIEYLNTDPKLFRFIKIHFNEEKDKERRSMADQKFHERYLKNEWESKIKKIREMFGIAG